MLIVKCIICTGVDYQWRKVAQHAVVDYTTFLGVATPGIGLILLNVDTRSIVRSN